MESGRNSYYQRCLSDEQKKKKEGMNTIKKDNKFQPREMNTSNKKALSNMKKIKNSGRRPELRKKK